MKKQPKISIIIPSYNRASKIGRTVESFVVQTFKDWEMIVVDDHSTDNTKEIIEEYQKRDARIGYMLNKRAKGAQGARNTGILHANAEWVVLFDSDDYAYPDYLSKMMPYATEEYDVVTCDVRAVAIDGSEANRTYWGAEGYVERELMTRKVYVNNNNAVIRKTKLEEIGLLDEDCAAFQELDTHLRLSAICRYKKIDEVLLDWFIGGTDTITSKKKLNRNARCYVVWHNRKRWRELEYNAFIHEVFSLFAHSSLKARWLLIKAAPEILLFWPAVYINIVIRLINRKCNTQIPQI